MEADQTANAILVFEVVDAGAVLAQPEVHHAMRVCSFLCVNLSLTEPENSSS
jgi:hypothetical protein